MDKKKIYIFTIHVYNYGAVLQACALRLFCERAIKGSDVRIANFYHKRYNHIFRRLSDRPLINVALNILSAFRYYALRRRMRREARFIHEYGNLSERYDSCDDLLKNPPAADCYISGSDQVFNSNAMYPQLFYLGFEKTGHVRKIAYAPSFGFSIFSEAFIESISGYVKDFDALSCRERSGADLLSRISGRKVPVVVDPTMLLSQSEWELIAVNPQYARRYIFIYDLNGAEHLVEIARKIEKQTGYAIVCLTGKVQKFYKVDKQIYDAGPAEFIGWIKNAAYVVTDSFHGTVFSLIFHRRFYAYVALEKAVERLTSLLDNFGMTDRLIRNSDEEIDVEDYSETDYQSVMDESVLLSKAYLINAIKNCNE